jgi:hypothetical protein
MATAAATATVQAQKKDTRNGRVKSDALHKWALGRAGTLPKKAGDKLNRDLWPDVIIPGPNPSFENRGDTRKDLQQFGVTPWYNWKTSVIFWAPTLFWPEGVPDVKCPDCGSSERVTRDGWSDSLRAVTAVFATIWLLASRHKCKECPKSVGKHHLFVHPEHHSSGTAFIHCLTFEILKSH